MGIDPGSRATGYGVICVERSRLDRLAGGVIRCGDGTPAERLARIDLVLSEMIAEIRPDVAALETVFTARNPRAALLLGQARGVALAACGRSGLDTAEYAPAQVKLAVVGYGRADKPQVQRMVQRLLRLAAPPSRDEADALAVAICHAHTRTFPRAGRALRTAATPAGQERAESARVSR